MKIYVPLCLQNCIVIPVGDLVWPSSGLYEVIYCILYSRESCWHALLMMDAWAGSLLAWLDTGNSSKLMHNWFRVGLVHWVTVLTQTFCWCCTLFSWLMVTWMIDSLLSMTVVTNTSYSMLMYLSCAHLLAATFMALTPMQGSCQHSKVEISIKDHTQLHQKMCHMCNTGVVHM